MKVLLACLAVAVVVLAEDVFFYDHNGGDVVHRTTSSCYVMRLTQEQQANVVYDEVTQLLLQLQADDTKVSPLTQTEASAFVIHHCHNKDLFKVTQ